MKPLEIVMFADGRPGHEKQTKGVLQALSKLTPVRTVRTFTVDPCFKTGLSGWFRYLVSIFERKDRTTAPVDLIIGTGSYTHLPMLLFKKTCRARVVTCMTPGLLLRGRFDLCFVPLHDRRRPAENFFFTTGPPNNLVPQDRHDRGKGLVLIGGLDPKSHIWESERVIAQVKRVVESDPAVSWTVSSSPRTPAETLAQLESLPARDAGLKFFRCEDTGAGWIEEQYARSEQVWVTADSVSMIFEALTAGCRVGVLPVEWKRKNNKFQHSLEMLQRNGQIVFFEAWQSGKASLKPAAGLDEASRCAEEILRRWWPDRLK